MTFISWALEFTSGIIAVMMYIGFLFGGKLLTWILSFDVSLNFIIIPGSYIINSKAIKAKVFDEGWRQSCVSFVRPNRIVPAQNQNLARDAGPHALASPIRTISANVRPISLNRRLQNVPESQENQSRQSLNLPNLFSFEMNTLPNAIDC